MKKTGTMDTIWRIKMTEQNPQTPPTTPPTDLQPQTPPITPPADSQPQTPPQPQSDNKDEIITYLLNQNKAMQDQIANLVNNGAQLNDQPQTAPPQVQQTPQYITQAQQLQGLGMQLEPDPLAKYNPISLSSTQDVSLEGLASEIGKKE